METKQERENGRKCWVTWRGPLRPPSLTSFFFSYTHTPSISYFSITLLTWHWCRKHFHGLTFRIFAVTWRKSHIKYPHLPSPKSFQQEGRLLDGPDEKSRTNPSSGGGIRQWFILLEDLCCLLACATLRKKTKKKKKKWNKLGAIFNNYFGCWENKRGPLGL